MISVSNKGEKSLSGLVKKDQPKKYEKEKFQFYSNSLMQILNKFKGGRFSSCR